jgi:hypothetical protein
MIEVIDWYEAQKERYTPIIRQFENELAFYVGSDLSEFKINLPAFQLYLESDRFKNKFDAALKAFRIGIAKSKISNGQKESESDIKINPINADGFAELVNTYLDKIADHEISVPNITLVEILFALANTNNTRLKQQQSLYKQIFVRLSNETFKQGKQSDAPICVCLDICSYIGDLGMVLLKDNFNETDVQYPLLLALSLSHTSPREVQFFLDKQTPQYEGDFSKVLETALLEYDGLLLPSQIKEAHKWLKEYKPPHTETVEIVEETEKTNELKPIIGFHSLYVNDVFEILKGYFNLSEYANLQTLLNGQTIEGTIYFRGTGASLFCGFRDLLGCKIILSSQAETIRWLVTYITADNQKGEKNSRLIIGTVEKYFEGEKKKSHNRINFDEIIKKKLKK